MTTPKEETPQCPGCGTTALKLANPSQHGSHVCGNRNCANGCFYPATPPLDRAAHIAAMHAPLVAMLERCAAKFREYEEIHNAKDRAVNSTVSVSKATRNARMAEAIESLIAQAKEGAQ